MHIFILLVFSKLEVQNKAINFIAASSFAVILVHGNPYIFPYTEKVLNIYSKNNYLTALGYVALMNIVVFVLAVVIDQMRILSWNLIVRKRQGGKESSHK